ncbi:uncharacterized protein NMK_2837 [Novimethylophilus kurashikiensis]|uniref:CorA-like Mg2+ transporter protein n=1 Tax=Novimethylophilus kurashikiensis TaxID=1825523 RepID=A0A2R5FG73_9PROT|nr:hypothetical protein [Novimethylophilus kurashikiensis]GBG15234.1 uncharacterized protein NMK_2837 [Novimethylophilus kurashikiensis]
MSQSGQQPAIASFRQVLLWPVQLIPQGNDLQIHPYWDYLAATPDTPWNLVQDEFNATSGRFSERRYREFVTFLPFAQRFLYGEGIRGQDDSSYGQSPIRVFTRSDVAQARIKFGGDLEPHLFTVDHTDLYFFYDIDIAILVVEIIGDKLPLDRAMETLFRFGRAYPSHWEQNGQGGHCAEKVEWLDKQGNVLAASDYEQKERYLKFVREQRVPRVASHWEYLLKPLVQHYSDEEGLIRYREIEYQRMPLMSYMAFDDVSCLTRGDLIRLGLVTRPGDSQSLPYSEGFLQDFEARYCYDRYWEPGHEHWGNTRIICNGQSFTVLGSAGEAFFTDKETGIISQFRHQYFLLFLIAHFQKAALLMLSDRLVSAISRLDIDDPESIRDFRKNVRHTLEIFLRFTHRYWFQSVSDQAQSRDLFAMMIRHLDTQELFERTRRRILDMTEYLDSDQLKRHAEIVIRLTVVTTFGLIGTVATGVLGMNLFADADSTPMMKLAYFMAVFVPVTVLTLYTIVKSKRLSVFLDALSDERLSSKQKFMTLFDVWARKKELNE